MFRKWIGFGIALGMLTSLAAFGEAPAAPTTPEGAAAAVEKAEDHAHEAGEKAKEVKKAAKADKKAAKKKAKKAAQEMTSPVTESTEAPAPAK